MGALQYVHVPGYAAMIFRNTFSDLSLPGALMSRAQEWLGDSPASWNGSKNTWTFPSGATLTFGYLDKPNDYLRYKSSELQYIAFDEVSEIREQHYRYLFSRLRRPSGRLGQELARVPLRMRSASNPAPNWVRQRFIVEGAKEGRIYIPSGIDDNPYVDKAAYEQSLGKLNQVDYARLALGDWWAEEAGSKFDRVDFQRNIITRDEVPLAAMNNCVRYWDVAATQPSQTNPDPDWTAGALVAIHDGIMYIIDVRRFRVHPAQVESSIYHTALEDGPAVKIRMEKEGGASGKSAIDHYARHILLGFDFDGHPAISNKSSRIDLWAAKAKRDEIKVVRGPWNTEFIDEAVSFGAAKDLHDDQLDAVSGAFEVLTGLGSKMKRKMEIIV